MKITLITGTPSVHAQHERPHAPTKRKLAYA